MTHAWHARTTEDNSMMNPSLSELVDLLVDLAHHSTIEERDKKKCQLPPLTGAFRTRGKTQPPSPTNSADAGTLRHGKGCK
jgi:hypothetical protein